MPSRDKRASAINEGITFAQSEFEDRNGGSLAQIFSLGGCNSWASLLGYKGNQLHVTRHGHCNRTPDDDRVIMENTFRDR